MSKQQFNTFLVGNIIAWLNTNAVDGYRYRFYSDNADNICSLLDAIDDKKAGSIKYGGSDLPFIQLEGYKLVYVDDIRGQMSENFISNIREAIQQDAVFENCILLVLHRSRLDTLLSATTDLSLSEYPLNAIYVESEIKNLISTAQSQALYQELLKIQKKIIQEQKQSAFGYQVLYDSIVSNQCQFKEMGLFKDPLLLTESKPDIIRKRLQQNQDLHDDIENVIVNYPAEIVEKLLGYSQGFIQKNITIDDWQEVSYDKLVKEKQKNKASSIAFDCLELDPENFTIRDDSDTASGKRKKNIIYFVGEGVVSMSIGFKGDGLNTSDFDIVDNKELKKIAEIKYNGVSRRLTIEIPSVESPLYFKIKLNGTSASDRYEFKFLILQERSFYLKNIKTQFLVETNKKRIKLQLSNFVVCFSDNQKDISLVTDSSVIDVTSTPNIDLTELYDTQEEVTFNISNGSDELSFLAEGAKEEKSISIPLIFNQGRLNKLFENAENAEFKGNQQKAVLDNREFKLVAERFTYIDLEDQFIRDNLFLIGEGHQNVALLEGISQSVFNTFSSLLKYFKDKKTTPSLCAWDDEVSKLAKEFVDSFTAFLDQATDKAPLSENQKLIFQMGKVSHEGSEYFSPFSPLILAYILQLRNVAKDDNSFAQISSVTFERLNPKGLFPYLYKGDQKYSFSRVVAHDALWLEFIPDESSDFKFVSKLTTEKLTEFTKAFESLFEYRHDAPIKINSINNGSNIQVFDGIVRFYKNTFDSNPKKMVINLYDKEFMETAFDVFSDTDSYEDLKVRYKLDKNAETIIDVMRTHITYSKHDISEDQSYAHLSFFKNAEEIKVIPRSVEKQKSGLVCNGLISGESSEEETGYYYSGFGLRGVDISDQPLLKVAKLYNAMQRSVYEAGQPYEAEETISLMISDSFKELLKQSYENSLWTVIIDPKVTLDFFNNKDDLILIHYSDQYSSSANYDAITVTGQKDLYASAVGSETIIREFNAFNGEWLIKMIAEKDGRNKREKRGIIAAYKLMTAMVDVPGIIWVPLSVAEMLRVAGNVGLSMSKGDFSRYNEMSGNTELKAGAISDDILLVGFCKTGGVVLYPVEVKSGSADMNKAKAQAESLRSFFYDHLFNCDELKTRLLKGLFIRQVFMQVDKYELYDIFKSDYYDGLHEAREALLKGEFKLLKLQSYTEGAVVAFLDTLRDSNFTVKDSILECRLPSAYQDLMLEESYLDLKAKVRKGELGSDLDYVLNDVVCVNACDGIDRSVNNDDITGELSVSAELTSEVTPDEIELIEPSVAEQSKPKIPMEIKFGVNVQNKNDIIWQPTNSTKTLNTNTGIIGTMGTGKTQFTKSLIAQLVRDAEHNVDGLPIGILVFDYKGDYVKPEFTEPTGAKVLSPHHLPYNPLALFGKKPLLPVHTTNLFKTTLSKAFGLGTIQQSNLSRVIMEAYERRGINKANSATWSKDAPTIQDVWDVYSNEEKVAHDSLYAALSKLIEFEIFEPIAENTMPLYDFVNGITVINLSGYDSDLQNLIVAITLDVFYTQMHINGSSKLDGNLRQITKMILVDEADNFMSQNFESLKKILKEGREFGVGTILSTQQLTHFKTSDDNYANYIQSWIVHQVSNIKSGDITSIFNISSKSDAENLMKQIRRLEKHFSIYVDGDKNMVKMRDLAFWELN